MVLSRGDTEEPPAADVEAALALDRLLDAARLEIFSFCFAYILHFQGRGFKSKGQGCQGNSAQGRLWQGQGQWESPWCCTWCQ